MSNPTVSQDAIKQWRITVLDTVTKVLFFLALPLLVVNSFLAVYDGRIEAFLIGLFSVIALGVITFRRSLGMRLRGFTVVALSFIAGTYWLATTGLPGTGRLYFLFVVVLAALLFQKRIAFWIWFVSITTVGLVFIAFAVGLLPPPVAILNRLFDPATLTAGWIAQGVISVAVGTAIVMAVDTAHKSLAQAETAARELQQLNDTLEKRVRDQTEELQRQADFLQRTQRAARIGSFHIDFGADRWESSETIDEILGIDSTYQRTKEGWLRLVHPFDQDRLRSDLEAPTLTAAGNYSIEYRIKRADTGESRWVHALGKLTVNERGETTGTYGTLQDITERKEMEHLRETVDHVMRHDLRSPLNAIVNVPAILIELGGLSSDQIDLLRAVEESGQLMVSMIDSSLNMLKMERGSFEMRREPIDLIKILENVIHQNGVLIQRSNIDVSIVVDGRDLPADTRIQIFSDKTNLYTMISNLVVNAVEASSDHEPIQLRVDTASPLTVSIVNQGTVPIAIREKFFEKFATFGKKKGTGLGTYSAKLIANTFGYSIDMNTSDETNQTTVTITMHGAESEA